MSTNPIFPLEFITDLLTRVDLYDLMKKHGVQVKYGQGKNHFFIASWCCNKTDFDNGRIKKERQTYKCGVCMKSDEGGKNAIHFLREFAGKSYVDAVYELCEIAGVEPPVKNKKVDQKEKRREKALFLAAEFYHAQNNFEYFKSRGISEEVLVSARAGYAPGGRALREHLESKGYTKEELLEYKLLNTKGLDAFYYRAILPQFCNGVVVDLYGRAVDQRNHSDHFYLQGDSVLNGIDQVNPDLIVNLFESDIDRNVALSHKIINGVHPGGAHKFEAHHVRLLVKKGVKRVAIMFDGDKAGRKGAMDAGELLIKAGISVLVVEFPEGMDPAEILQNGGGIEALTLYTRKAKPFHLFKMYDVLDQYSVDEIQKYLVDRKENVLIPAEDPAVAVNESTYAAG